VKLVVSAAGLGHVAEATLIKLAVTGDKRAFEELVRRRQRQVRNFMYYLCRHATERDDLAQQVFLTLWRSIGTLRSADAFDGWLKRIMVTTWQQSFRRQRVDFTDESQLPEPGTSPESPSQRLDLNAALALLPPGVRLCLVLAYDGGMTHEEIAAATEMPLGTVKSHILRGSARLRELLADYRHERTA
jgi:RNA polymerase sigma-70 factor (ECF subfamily)